MNELRTIQPAKVATFTPEQIGIIKNTVAVGVSDGELALFLEVCKSTNLNPFKRQIYAVVRKTKSRDANGNWSEVAKMVIQTGIDGYRKTAQQTGLHSGTTDPEYGPEHGGYPTWARVTVKKLLPTGRDAEFTATARWTEYVQTVKDYKTGSIGPNTQWQKMPFLMLGKCAEALALRKAFPDELSGVYTDEEMEQADSVVVSELPPTEYDWSDEDKASARAMVADLCEYLAGTGMELDEINKMIERPSLTIGDPELSPERWTDRILAYRVRLEQKAGAA